jgi:hypothetical protein
MDATVNDERLHLLDALIYGDVFDCAVTLDELWRYARAPIEREELRRRMRDDPVLRRLVTERDGLYCLSGSAASIDARPARIERARRLQKRARRLARLLRHLPFVRGLLLTGSASADDAARGADVDLLVIVAAGRLGTVFLLLAPLASLLRGRLFCPNWYMCEGRLGSDSRTLYIARELAQAHGLSGDADDLFHANPWIRAVFPNASPPAPVETHLQRRTATQRCFETLLGGAAGHALERRARRLARARLRAHYARFGLAPPHEVAARFEAGSALGFHGYRYEASTLRAYASRRLALQTRLASIAGGS